MALSYAIASNVETRLFGTTSVTAINHTIIAGLCTQTNEFIERKTMRPIGPGASTAYTIDGNDALENGRLMLFPRGFQSISLLEVAAYTDAAFQTIPSTDYFPRPAAYTLEPGWPFTEIWMTDIPSSGNPYPYFPPGIANVRVTLTPGWASIPADLVEVAEILVVRAFNSRQTGQQGIGSDETGEVEFSRLLDVRDLYTLKHYAWKPVITI